MKIPTVVAELVFLGNNKKGYNLTVLSNGGVEKSVQAVAVGLLPDLLLKNVTVATNSHMENLSVFLKVMIRPFLFANLASQIQKKS